MIVISDTSPITNLAAVELLELLHILYDRVVIPQAVYDEMTALGYQVPGTVEVQNLDWIETQSVSDRLRVEALQAKLDLGEAEAIVLALELDADLLLIDERRGRQEALEQGVTKISGLLGILQEAKAKGLISTIKPVLDRLISENNFRISDRLYYAVVKSADE
ncbi:DUF3368 domain-containing protein [Roseofilum capinflatum]|uniref:DUF3368 domain-containing protein n=1 Tax=Roseofilum capinflatum BLCC-M114 TaxID=3022440 RepID=A0ABT7B503_9CYAN|nr:DUF3368 domain-containing protein [Roseofilum capinflatum]MDJ1174254.1 DUF3368 domain-containing protein [Roseofilum capinflatum BLCC-M114]